MNSWQTRVIGATGGLLQNSPIVCGGSQNRNNYLTSQQIEMKMIEKRTFAASVALDQSTLWIVGLFNGRTVNTSFRVR